jgi:hypothetical protein
MKKQPILALLLILALAFSTACGSIGKTTYNSLELLKAAYVTANSSRNDFCQGKDPRPQVCIDSYAPLLVGYQTLKQGSELLAVYEETRDAEAKAKLKAFLPLILSATTEVLKTSFATAPAPTPPPQ